MEYRKRVNKDNSQLLYRQIIYTVMFGLKQIPGVGCLLEWNEGRKRVIKDFIAEQERLDLQARVAQLESASGWQIADARRYAEQLIAESRQQGRTITTDHAAAVVDIVSCVPATIKCQIAATVRQAAKFGTATHQALPISEAHPLAEREAFYFSLLPARRPSLQSGDALPHYNPQWRVLELLGAGGFGEVWRVRHSMFDDELAVKFCLDTDSGQVLKREAQALFTVRKQLPHHPNIVQLIDLQFEEEPYWLAFEYVGGGTLESLMQAVPLSWQTVVELLIPIVQGIQAVHAVGIVHRDLKPANILLTAANVPKIADFGIGKVTAEQAVGLQLTQTFTTVGYGSLGYMSPEQQRGEGAHPADDVYALGVLLWQLLSHTLQEPDFRAIIRELPHLAAPEVLKTLVMDCMTAHRAEQATVERFLATLVAVLNPVEIKSTLAESPTPVKPTQATPQPHKLKLPTSAKPAKAKQEPFNIFQDKLRNGSVAPKMVYLPSGIFQMGSDHHDQKPVHKVELSAFAIGQYPLTVGEFKAFVHAKNYRTEAERRDGTLIWTRSEWVQKVDAHWQNPYMQQTDQDPVICISWNDAMAYCQWLSEQTDKIYRLPTEAEWEYACRSGSRERYYFGDDEQQLSDYAWYSQNADKKTHPVGQKYPNQWGLYDMHGNVSEWCQDWYAADYYRQSPRRDPQGPAGGDYKLVRGGSWCDLPDFLRAASRDWGLANNGYTYFGLRVVCSMVG